MPITVTRDLLRRLPKAELHLHLDGSLRPQTMLDLADEYGKKMPAGDAEALRDYMHVQDATNLVDYLARFATTLSVMQTPEALERIAYELVEDAAEENVRYLEIRYCPALHTEEGMSLEQTVDAPLRGMRRAEADFGVRAGLIICGLRHLPPENAVEMGELAVSYAGRGVVAYDLAGGEADNPARNFTAGFRKAWAANLPVTVHAGEAAGAESVWEAIHLCGARRIGHGTRLVEDQGLFEYVRDQRIPIEICLTSNVQTKAVRDFGEHPLKRYLDEGLVLSMNTDNRLMSATTVTEELWRAHEHLGLDWEELVELALMSFESAFLPWGEKQDLVLDVVDEIQQLEDEVGDDEGEEDEA
jgi:adenosine deaminase